MRACEGCRRRKIKCDAATTNTWPCSACVRLKLHCVPPMVQYDRDFAPSQPLEQDTNGEFDNSSGSGEEEHSSGYHIAGKPNRAPLPNYQLGRDGSNTYRNKKKKKGSCKREFIEYKIFIFCRQYLCNI